MPWGRIALAVFASGFVSSMTDWLFAGDWLYKRYDRHPEIWRYQAGQGENKAILWSSLFPFLTCGVFVLLCSGLQLHTYGATFKLAAAMWIKLAPAIATSYAVGWLVKLALAALAVVLILG
jgi:hypothetical protein